MDDETAPVLSRARAGDSDAIGRLLEHHRERLRLGIDLRQNPLVRGRFDASDVIQEAFTEAAARLPNDYDESVPLFVWLRFLVQQQLFALTRRHLGTRKRDAAREVVIADDMSHSTQIMAEQLVSRRPSPSVQVRHNEMRQEMEVLLDQMNTKDRELLMLRHYEQLSNVEAAAVMKMNPSTASSRYVRALQWLRKQMVQFESRAES